MSAVYEAKVGRYDLWRILDMPGLSRIDIVGNEATLTFTTAPGCEPCGEDLIASELRRMGLRAFVVATASSRERSQ